MPLIHNIHAHNTNSSAILSISPADPIPEAEQVFSIGIHPWFIAKNISFEQVKEEFAPFLRKANCVAIGECGLDRLRGPEISIQLAIFEYQLRLAEEHHLPVIIHCVKAFDELVALRKKHPSGQWILHGFSKNLELANQLLHADIVLSFGTNLLNNEKLQHVFRNLPVSKTYLETDDQDPELIYELYACGAQLKSLPLKNFQKEMEERISLIFNTKRW